MLVLFKKNFFFNLLRSSACPFLPVKCLSRKNPRKAPGSDGLKGRGLKVCAEQLGGVFTHMFLLFLNGHFIPHSWKVSTFMPVPGRPGAKEMNDFRPVAPTSIIAKCMERIVCNQLIVSVSSRMDPLQFAFRAISRWGWKMQL